MYFILSVSGNRNTSSDSNCQLSTYHIPIFINYLRSLFSWLLFTYIRGVSGENGGGVIEISVVDDNGVLGLSDAISSFPG